ncbi:MAG: hypothetical protein KF847_10230 [Pirellulales bacterium]|nr:hypothetical protein [Pirellulales bacterium]
MGLPDKDVWYALQNGPTKNDRRGQIDYNASHRFPGHEERMKAHRKRVQAVLAEERSLGRVLSAEERIAIAELRSQGLTYQQIGDRFGLKSESVRSVIRTMRNRKSDDAA